MRYQDLKKIKDIYYFHFFMIIIIVFAVNFFINGGYTYDDAYILEYLTKNARINNPGKVNYPSFVYEFFKILIDCLSVLKISKQSCARSINVILFITNSCLIRHFLSLYVDKKSAILGSIFFMLNPIVYYSVVHFKVESLLLLEMILFLIYINRIHHNHYKIKSDHIMLALLLSLSIVTKYNFFPIIVYLINYFSYIYKNNESEDSNYVKKLLLFSFSLAAFLLVLWPDFHEFIPKFLKYQKLKMMNKEGYGFFYAINSYFEIPNGIISSVFLITLPQLFGLPVYILSISGIIYSRNEILQKELIGGFIFVILYIAFYTFMYTLRITYFFVPIIPLVILYFTFVIQYVINNRILTRGLFVLIIFSLINGGYLVDYYQGVMKFISKHKNIHGEKLYNFTFNTVVDVNHLFRILNYSDYKRFVISDRLIRLLCEGKKDLFCNNLKNIISNKNNNIIVKDAYSNLDYSLFYNMKIYGEDKIYLLERVNKRSW